MNVFAFSQSEADFTSCFVEYAQLYGWRIVHFRPAMLASGKWATHGQGDVTGWPDCFLTRGHRAIAVELKSEKGRTTEAQTDWLEALARTGIEAHVWRPSDWPTIEAILGRCAA